MRVFLCGMPKSGKSTLARELGILLIRPVIDTDREIEQWVQQEKGAFYNCRQICTQFGEAYFREIERGILQRLALPDNAVIALGGGFLMSEYARGLVKTLGRIAYLYADVECLWQRMALDLSSVLDAKRPYESFQELFAQRHPIYSGLAHITIAADEPPQVIACQLQQYIEKEGHGQ